MDPIPIIDNPNTNPGQTLTLKPDPNPNPTNFTTALPPTSILHTSRNMFLTPNMVG